MPKHAAIRKAKPLSSRPKYIGRTPHDGTRRLASPETMQAWRERISTGVLITRLQNFAIDDPDNPTGPRMTRTQATVALSLLRKVLPDMQSLEISGNSDKPITVQVLRFSDADVIDIAPVVNQVVDQTEEPPGEPQNSSIGLGQYVQDRDIEGLPPAIENNPRLIEDERSRRPRKS